MMWLGWIELGTNTRKRGSLGVTNVAGKMREIDCDGLETCWEKEIITRQS